MGRCERCGKETGARRYCQRCRSKLFFGDLDAGLPDCFDWEAGKAGRQGGSERDPAASGDEDDS